MIGHIKERLMLLNRKKELSDLHQVLWVYSFVFVIWGVYRLLFPVHVWIEETILKFIVFGIPTFWVVFYRDKKTLEDLGMSTRGLIVSLYFGLLFGLWLAVFGNVVSFINDGSIGFNPNLTVADFRDLLVLGLFTAFWEQLLFMGYMLPRVIRDLRHELLGILVVALLFATLHMPVQIVSGASVAQILVRFILLFSLEFGNGVLYSRFKNLAAPIFAHMVWGSVIYLFG